MTTMNIHQGAVSPEIKLGIDQIADVYLEQGRATANEQYAAFCNRHNLMLWERKAIADKIMAAIKERGGEV